MAVYQTWNVLKHYHCHSCSYSLSVMFSGVHFSPSIPYCCISVTAMHVNPPNCSCRTVCWWSMKSEKEQQYKDDPTSYTEGKITVKLTWCSSLRDWWRIIYRQTTQLDKCAPEIDENRFFHYFWYCWVGDSFYQGTIWLFNWRFT